MASRLSSHVLAASLYGRAYNMTCGAEARPIAPRRRVDGHYTLCEECGRLRADCNVVSIGIGEDWHFESWLAQRGCSVHAFDPTIRSRAKHSAYAALAALHRKRITFHFAGLGADLNRSICKVKDVGDVPCRAFQRAFGKASRLGTSARNLSRAKRDREHPWVGRKMAVRTWFNSYGTVAGDRLLPLHALLRMASVDERRLDVLKIDCEGCEWDAFDDLVGAHPQLLGRVDQIIIELHLRLQFQLNGMEQLERLLSHLLLDHGFRIFRAVPNAGVSKAISHTQAPASLTAAGFETGKYATVELSLARPPGRCSPLVDERAAEHVRAHKGWWWRLAAGFRRRALAFLTL